MKRRGFFSLALGALCAPFLPKVKPPGLMFHKDAFAMTMAPLCSGDVACSAEDFSKLAQPHLDAAKRQPSSFRRDVLATWAAEIVSREFGVPAIVGIPHITKILKDGDLVEVDARKGVVRKLE